MKSITLVAVILLTAFTSFGDSYYFAWDGYGFATRHNLSLVYGYGSYQYKGVAEGLGLGFMEINQNYDLFYNRDNGGPQGSSLRLRVNYYYLSPMFVFQFGKKGNVQGYVTAGLGIAQSGLVEQHKWSNLAWSAAGQYDSTIDQTDGVNMLVFRFGGGLSEFYHLGGNFHLFFSQDFGVVANSMLKSSDSPITSETAGAIPSVKPTMFSLRFGIAFITHSRDSDNPYRIHKGVEPE